MPLNGLIQKPRNVRKQLHHSTTNSTELGQLNIDGTIDLVRFKFNKIEHLDWIKNSKGNTLSLTHKRDPINASQCIATYIQESQTSRCLFNVCNRRSSNRQNLSNSDQIMTGKNKKFTGSEKNPKLSTKTSTKKAIVLYTLWLFSIRMRKANLRHPQNDELKMSHYFPSHTQPFLKHRTFSIKIENSESSACQLSLQKSHREVALVLQSTISQIGLREL